MYNQENLIFWTDTVLISLVYHHSVFVLTFLSQAKLNANSLA